MIARGVRVFENVASGRILILLWMDPYSCTCGQNQLDLVGYPLRRRRGGGGGWERGGEGGRGIRQ